MAKKQQKPKEDSNIPMSIMGLSSGKKSPSITQLAKKVNNKVVGGDQESQVREEEAKAQTEDKQNNAQDVYVYGRPKKGKGKLVKATHNNDWDNFLDYAGQYYEKGCEADAVTIDVELKKHFVRLKYSMEKTDIRSIVSAILRIFLENHKDKIVDMINSKNTIEL